MSLEVFRRHQRKLLAIFAILAMFGFVVSDSLPKLLSPSYAGRDQRVVTLKWKTIYQSDVNRMAMQRSNANQFVSLWNPYLGQTPFGGLKNRDIVDALILEHEADRLGLPANADMGRLWLKQVGGQGRMRMTKELFEAILARYNNQVSGDQILADIANQVRLANVRQLLGAPIVTPLDVFRAYRDQNERVAAKAVEVPADRFLAKVPDPSPQEVQEYFDRYKDVLPDPSRPTPGFKVPRQVQLEILSIDGNAVARSIKDNLNETELRTAYENHKSEYQVMSELPTDLFAGQPDLTPPILRTFDDVRSTLAYSLAEEKAQSKIVDQFDAIKRNVLFPFADKYHEALTDIEEAKSQGAQTKATLPAPTDLEELAKREHLGYELTPMLSRADAENYGEISHAELGLTRLSGGHKFAEEFFDTKDPKANLFEPEEFADLRGWRYLVRKIKDVPPRVPSLEEVRPQVSLAWKMERARPLAWKSAEQMAEGIKKKEGTIQQGTVDGYRVLTIPAIARRQSSLLTGRFEMQEPEETPIPDVPHAGEAFRDAYFSLQKGSTAIAPNQPETAYYVLALERREPATFAALYAPNGDEFRYKIVARDQAERDLIEHWMGWLRKEAELPPDWVPPDEAKGETSAKRG